MTDRRYTHDPCECGDPSCAGCDEADVEKSPNPFKPNMPDLNKPVFKSGLFPEAADNIAEGNCATCGRPIGKFRDALSRREFSISGMCQGCQDSVFGGPEE